MPEHTGGLLPWELRALRNLLTASAQGGGESLIHQETVLLNNAQIKALPTVLIEIVAAPGANKIAIPVSGAYLHTNSGDYTGIDVDCALALFYGNGAAVAFGAVVNDDGDSRADLTALLNGGALSLSPMVPNAYSQLAGTADIVGLTAGLVLSGADLATVVNAEIRLWMTQDLSGVDLTDGNAANTLRVSVAYLVLDVTTGVFE